MIDLLGHALLLADRGAGGWENLADARAGAISLVGLSAVFSGLVLICLFMVVLAYVTRRTERAAVAPAPVPEVTPESGTTEVDADEALPEPELVGPLSLPGWVLAAAQVARLLYERGRLELGVDQVVGIDGRDHTVRLLSVGLGTTALVDGRKVVFYQSRVARLAAN